MKDRYIGPEAERIPAVGQGTWQIGGDAESDRESVEALRRGLDLGLTLIDTAEMYGSGHAEELVGRAIRGRRKEVFLVSKVLPSHADREGVRHALEGSLRRLGTDHLDLYLLHWPSGSVPIEETVGALADLVAEGKTRMIGVSNFDVDELEPAVEAAGEAPLVCDQVLYWVGDRGIEWKLLDRCRRESITVMAYSPFGQGGLTELDEEETRALRQVAEARGGTIHQMALAWILRHRHVVAIPKASDPEHLRRNADAATWELDEEELALLDRAFPPPEGPTPLGIL